MNSLTKKLGHNSPCFIIAEIGVNHNGDFKLAQEMIDAAFEAGADSVKLQVVDPDESYARNTESYSIFSKVQLKENEIFDLVNNNRSKGIVFATPGDFKSLSICEKSKMEIYKVSSGLISNLPLIEKIAKTNKPMIISTGMAYMKEVDEAVKTAEKAGCKNICILHCVSIYPAPYDTINLKAINSLNYNKKYVVGYSDHSLGWLVSNAAVSMGAKIIEKHFIYDDKIKAADSHISLNFKDFKNMVEDIRSIESMLGDGKKIPHKSELEVRNKYRRFCVAKSDINPGDIFTEKNILFMRLGKKKGIPASDFKKFLYMRKSKKKITAGDVIMEEQ